MRIPVRVTAVALLVASVVLLLALAAVLGPQSGPLPVEAQGQVRMEWLGHMFFRFTSPNGTVILTTPNFRDGPAPISLADLGRVDLMLIPNGHSDDRGEVLAIAAANPNATVIAPNALGAWLVEQGLNASQLVTTGPGTTHTVSGVRVRTVRNVHDETISGSEPLRVGGAVGYIISFGNGFTVYCAASSDVSAEMQVYGRLYQPQVALLNCNNRDPALVAEMVRLIAADNPNLQSMVCTHTRFDNPVPERVADELRRAGLAVRVLQPGPGEQMIY